MFGFAGMALALAGNAIWTGYLEQRQSEQIPAVAAALAEPVAQKVLADGRAESAESGRAALAKWNGVLTARGLPIVPSPPVDATSSDVAEARAAARVLTILPDDVTARLRDAVRDGRLPRVLPSANLTDLPEFTGDRVVVEIPGQAQPGELFPVRPSLPTTTGARPGPSTTAPGTTAPAPSGPAPTTPAAPPRRTGCSVLGIDVRLPIVC